MDARLIASRALENARQDPEHWIAAVESAHETYSGFVSRSMNPTLAREFLFMEIEDGGDRFPPGFSAWVETLAHDGGRLNMLSSVASVLREMVDAETGTVRALVESHPVLTPGQAADFETAIAASTGARRVVLTCVDRPDLIGGGRVVVGDRVTELSVAGMLDSMRRAVV